MSIETAREVFTRGPAGDPAKEGYVDWEQAQDSCICGMCPSYNFCGEKIAFCMPESPKSQCIRIETGCLCPGCPVQGELGFRHEFYCTRGNEKELARG